MAPRIFKSLCVLLCLVSSINCWSTSTTESCTTRLRKGPPKTTTITATRYVEHVSTATSTPSDIVAFTTTTTTGHYTLETYWYSTTSVVTYDEYYDVSSEEFTSTTSTFLVTYTSTSGLTTTTVSTPPGFTPAASVTTDTSSLGRLLAAKSSATNTRVICHEKYILATTTTTTVRALSTITYTETTSPDVSLLFSYATSTRSFSGTAELVSFILETTTDATYTITDIYYTTDTTSTTTTVPTATRYAACATNNVISTIGPGQDIIYLQYLTSFNPLYTQTLDPYSCCVECFEMANCTGMVYDVESYGTTCILFFLEIGAHCNASAGAGWYYEAGDTDGSVYYISNGPCGQGVLL